MEVITIFEALGINPIDIVIVVTGLVLLDYAAQRLRKAKQNYEPGFFLDFFPDGKTFDGKPYLLCPVCKGGVLVPTHDRDLACKTVIKHMKRAHPSHPPMYMIKDKAEPPR